MNERFDVNPAGNLAGQPPSGEEAGELGVQRGVDRRVDRRVDARELQSALELLALALSGLKDLSNGWSARELATPPQATERGLDGQIEVVQAFLDRHGWAHA